jgi:RecG-like helicase
MEASVKHKTVEDLRNGNVNVLLCTTVVEVGPWK